MARSRQITLYCPRELREHWPKPLAKRWYSLYPQLFDDDDLRLTRNQPRYHFVEWFAATQMFHLHGVSALLKKYAFDNHPRKRREAERLLGVSGLEFLRSELRGQPPDLLLFVPGTGRFWFAEVKGPRDRPRRSQIANHRRLGRRFRVRTDLIKVRFVGRPHNRRLKRRAARM